MKLVLNRNSSAKLLGTLFHERCFIRTKTNKDILLDAASQSKWPIREKIQNKVGGKVDDQDDVGMSKFWKMIENQDKSGPVPAGLILLMRNLATSTSTSNLFQVFSLDYIYLQTQMSSKIIKEYPTQFLITQCLELSFVDQFLKKVLDLHLLKSLKSSLQDYQNAPFPNARSMFEIIKLEEVQRKYPVWAKILSSLSQSGTINESLAELLI